MTRIRMGSDESHFNVTLFVRVMEVGDEVDYTCRYTVITRMTCIQTGSDESPFNVSLIVKDRVTRQCP